MAHAIKNKNKRKKIFETTDFHCFYCGTELTEKNQTVDHIIPMTSGGGNGYSNLVPCCKTCNSKKSTRSLDRFRYIYSLNKQGIPCFTQEQTDWMSSKGVSIHVPILEKFYGEK